MSGSMAGVRADFASIVGDPRATIDPALCAAFAVDGVTPALVVYPASAEHVAEVLRCAAAHDLGVVPYRNGTKVGIGSPPRRYDVALSLKDMNRVWYYEPDDLVVSVEPGLKFGDLRHFLARHGLWIPLDPAGGERASAGGILAARAAGPLRLRYGGPRDMVLGMKIATVDGKIVKTGGRVVKNVAGYDFAKLLIGSFGTLGVIVEATFKLYPQVANRVTWMIDPGTVAAAREIRRELLGSPLSPMRMALLNGHAQHLLGSGTSTDAGKGSSTTGFAMFVEAGGSERVIARHFADLSALAAKYKASFHAVEGELASELWDRIADLGSWLTREKQVPVVIRAALPIKAGEEFLVRAEKQSDLQGCEVAGVLQLGTGVAELGLGATSPESRGLNPELLQQLRHIAGELGGSLVVTHCPADLKQKIDVWGQPGDDFEMMRKLKASWDPKGTLAPGRFVGGL